MWSKCKIAILITVLFLGSGYICEVYGQKFALKTNLLTWAALSPNLGAEVVVGSHLSINTHFTVRPFDYKGETFRFILIQPELRYWTGRPCSRHFMGITAFYTDNDLILKNTRYRGDGIAGGLTYGYNWVISKHWNLELTAGVGMMYARQFKYEKETVRPEYPNCERWIPVPVKCAISFVYIIK